jgi:sulfide:quinone oxidoreductase
MRARRRARSETPFEVVVVGGGVAGLETVMALRALAGGRTRITLVTPETEFSYRPLSVGEPFDLGAPQRQGLKRIATDLDFKLVHDRLDRVAPGDERVYTSAGHEIAYDALVLAMGARPQAAWNHVVTFSGSGDADAVRSVVGEIESGEVDSVAFVVPSGATWPLPLYELALLTAQRAEAAGVHAELAIYTPEEEPLAVFGREASGRVAAQLESAGVLVARSADVEVTADGDLVLPFEETPCRFDRVIALPRLLGPAPRGIPHDDRGFIPIDDHGLVRGIEHVYAAGDGTDYPVKHGGIAAEQADAVAEVIAKRAGAAIEPRPFRAVAHGQLLTGADPLFLRADLDPRASELSEASSTPLWWPVSKIASAHLSPYLSALEPAVAAVTAGGPPEPPATPEGRRIVFLPGEFENNPWGE